MDRQAFAGEFVNDMRIRSFSQRAALDDVIGLDMVDTDQAILRDID